MRERKKNLSRACMEKFLLVTLVTTYFLVVKSFIISIFFVTKSVTKV